MRLWTTITHAEFRVIIHLISFLILKSSYYRAISIELNFIVSYSISNTHLSEFKHLQRKSFWFLRSLLPTIDGFLLNVNCSCRDARY